MQEPHHVEDIGQGIGRRVSVVQFGVLDLRPPERVGGLVQVDCLAQLAA